MFVLLLCLTLVTPLCANTISLSVSCNSYLINTPSICTFTVTRNIDPLSFTVVTVNTAPVGSIIQITLPNDYNPLASAPTCTDPNRVNPLTCTVSGRTITITDYFSSTIIGSLSTLNLVFDKLLNPYKAVTTANYRLSILNPSRVIIDETPSSAAVGYSNGATFQPAPFQSCSISASGSPVSSGSTLTFVVNPRDPIPTDGQLLIKLPINWAIDVSGAQVISTAPSCTAITSVSSAVTCTYEQAVSGGKFIVKVNSFATSSLNTLFSFGIGTILTPPVVGAQDPITIESNFGDGTQINYCSAFVADLTPIPFQRIIFNSLTNTEVQSTFTGRLSLTLARPLYYQDALQLFLPNEFRAAVVSSSNFQSFTIVADGTTLTLSGFPSNPETLPSGNIIILQLAQITNALSTKPVTIRVRALRQGYSYQQSTTTYSATSARATLFSLTPSSLLVNSISPCLVSLSTTLTILSGSLLLINYPSSMTVANIAQGPVVTATIGSNAVTGVTTSTNSNQLSFKQLFQSTLTPGSLSLRVSQFMAPPSTQSLTYSARLVDSQNYQILSATAVLTGQKALLPSLSVSASSLIVLATRVTYKVALTSAYPFDQVEIIVPSSVRIGSSMTSTCSPSTFSSCTLDTTTNTVRFFGYQTAGSYVLSWGQNTNPNSLDVVDSFLINTLIGGQYVEKSGGKDYVRMATPAVASRFAVSPKNLINSATVEIEVVYILPALVPSGSISIKAPTQIDLTTATCQKKTVDPITLIATTTACTILGSTIRLDFNMNEPLSGTVTLNNCKNLPSFKPSPPWKFSLTNINGYDSISSDTVSWTNTSPSTFTLTVSASGFRAETALFVFSASGLNGKQTEIELTVSSLFDPITTVPASLTRKSTTTVSLTDSSTSASFSLSLGVPPMRGDFVFTAKSYTIDSFLISSAQSAPWTQNCASTNCRSCTASLNCLSCYSSALSEYNIYYTTDQTCIQSCSSGSFTLSSGVCAVCSAVCLTCSGTATTCTSCVANRFLDLVVKTCVQNCSPTYYADPASQTCVACTSPCLQCTSRVVCTRCVASHYLIGPECKTTCPTNFYIANDATNVCDPCSSNCETCSSLTNSCTSCKQSSSLLLLQGTTCVSVCLANFFPTSGVCTACQRPCKTCVNSISTCSSCYIAETLSTLFNNVCITPSQCPIGNYVNANLGICTTCPVNCASCTSSTACTSCRENYYLLVQSCVTECPTTTFLQGQTCTPCINCQTCTSASACTLCSVPSLLYQSKCYAQCPTKTFPSAASCVDCPQNCATCISSTHCSSCVQGFVFNSGACLTSCPAGTFYNSANTQCLVCPSNCATCTSLTNCLTCAASFSLQNFKCVKDCSVGLSYQQVCYPCGLHCSICQGSTCLLCNSNYLVENGLCVSSCSQTTVSIDDRTCLPCSTKYRNCTICSSTACLACANGQLVSGNCAPCPTGTYSANSQCEACPPSCTTCSSLSSCFSCKADNYLEGKLCVSSCPLNKVPNGTLCTECLTNCNVCNQTSKLCSVCSSGTYLFEQRCVQSCPISYVVSYFATSCVTQDVFYQQFSKASKIIPFPFTIGLILMLIISVALNCAHPETHLRTLLGSLGSWMELGSWVLFIAVEYIVLSNGQTSAIKGLACGLIAVVLQFIIGWAHTYVVYSYFAKDPLFVKWYRSHGTVHDIWTFLSVLFSFKCYRIVYSRTLNKDGLSMQLSSVSMLLPVNVLTLISFATSSLPIIIGSSLALFYSISTDQQFFVAFDTLVVSVLMLLILLIDLKRASSYFVDEVESKNIKTRIYIEGDQHLQLQATILQSNDVSKANLIQEDEATIENIHRDLLLESNKKLPRRPSQRYGNNAQNDPNSNTVLQFDAKALQAEESVFIDDHSSVSSREPALKWIPKKFDHHGYLLKQNQFGDIERYDEHGYLVEIDHKTGTHRKYNAEGLQVRIDQYGKPHTYDKDGFELVKGVPHDSRGYKVQKKSNGELHYFDKNGFEVVADSEGNQKLMDGDGMTVVIDEHGKITRLDENGFSVIADPSTGAMFRLNEDSRHMRLTPEGDWEAFDPVDGFTLKKNIAGYYVKYDENGLLVKKDMYGNVIREDAAGYRIIIGPTGEFIRFDDLGYRVQIGQDGSISRFDEDGFRVVLDENGQATLYDSNGYKVIKSYYGQPNFYDSQGYVVIIDPVTGLHHHYTQEGLQVKYNDGQKQFYDKRGHRLVDHYDGTYEKFDSDGKSIPFDLDGYQLEYDPQGNIVKYDRLGDVVEEEGLSRLVEDQQASGWELQVDVGAQAASKNAASLPTRKRRGFKETKKIDFEEEYSKLLQTIREEDNKSNNYEELPDLGYTEPIDEQNLQLQYDQLRTLTYNEDNPTDEAMKLSDLPDSNESNIALITKFTKSIKVSRANKISNALEGQEIDELEDIPSAANVSVDEQTLYNDGVDPLEFSDGSVDGNPRIMRSPTAIGMRRNPRSQLSKNKDTMTVYNYAQRHREGRQLRQNILDVEGSEDLSEQMWEGGQAYVFPKQYSNAETKAHEGLLYVEDDNEEIADHAKKPVKQRQTGRRSIQEEEDRMFREAQRQRAEFKKDDGTNPLFEYAKTIEAQKRSIKQKLYLDSFQPRYKKK